MVSGNGNPLVRNNEIEGNTYYGILNTNDTTIIDAENNWWGDATGPKHSSNPSGNGDIVSDYVDFDPWLDEPTANVILDRLIDYIEINQATQNVDNSVPLIANKLTLVRVYLNANSDIEGVTGSLTIYKDGVPICGPLSAINEPMIARANQRPQINIDHTLNFDVLGDYLDLGAYSFEVNNSHHQVARALSSRRNHGFNCSSRYWITISGSRSSGESSSSFLY